MFAKNLDSNQSDSRSGERPSDSAAVHGPHLEFSAEVAHALRECHSACEALTGRTGFAVRFGEKTCFDHHSMEVVIGVGQLLEIGVTDPHAIKFIVMHELGHFLELVGDTEGYLRVIDEGTRSDGLGSTYFRLYNSLMDIYVNTNTKNLAPVYGPEPETQESRDAIEGKRFSSNIEALYSEKLFAERDFASLPLCVQYTDYLLQLGMGASADITLAPEVKAKIDAGLHLFGKRYTYPQFIDTFLVPAIGHRHTRDWQATVSQRKAVIDAAIRPIFEELLKNDLASGKDMTKRDPGDPLEGIEPSPDDLRRAGRAIQRARAEANKSAAQKAADKRGDQAKDIGASAGLSPEEATAFAETLERVQPVVAELVRIFRSAVRQSVDWQVKRQGHFKTGGTLDVQQAIQQFPTILNDPSNAIVMERRRFEEQRVEHPKKIRLWLIPDLSGSMSGDVELLRDVSVAFSAALATLAEGKKLAQHELGGALRILGFNDSAVDIVGLTEAASLDDIARGYKKIAADGGTSDHTALEQVISEIQGQGADGMEDKSDCIDLLIEITDGETTDTTASRAAVAKLKSLGVRTLAYKLGGAAIRPDIQPNPTDPNESLSSPTTMIPSGQFYAVWGADGSYVRNLQAVLPAVQRALAEQFEAGG